MVFSSITFLCFFLPVVFLLHWMMKPMALKNLWLTVASLLFYAWGEPIFVLLMIGSTAMNWILGLLLGRYPSKKKAVLVATVILNIGLLVYFKYGNFTVEILNALPFCNLPSPNIRLPIGISFFTFQAMSYVFDVAKDQANVQKNPLHLLLYISLFPQLIAGPIVKYHQVEAQIYHRTSSVSQVASGIRTFLIGLAKKVLLANQMALLADTIFAMSPGGLDIATAWIGAIAYVFQIYFDFSGYSDMAIGLGRMFGFTFLENFNYPLTARGIQDFWRRWHISLSTWFREYLYIPLGGNRHGTLKTYQNQMIVFLATGLWHGANWTFVLWGLLHGICLLLETRKILPARLAKSRVYTLFVVTMLFVLFRADTLSYSWAYWGAMFTGFHIGPSLVTVLTQFTPYFLVILAVCLLSAGGVLPQIRKLTATWHPQVVEWISYGFTVALYGLCFFSLASNAYNPFIYFRF